ncbi:MAG: CHASE2 domain-containing protein [Thiotrichaceae bacterium]
MIFPGYFPAANNWQNNSNKKILLLSENYLHKTPMGVPFMFDISEERIGFNDLVIDPDGVIRRNLLYAETNEGLFTSFGLRIALHYLKQYHIEPESDATYPEQLNLGKAAIRPLTSSSGNYHNTDASGYQILLNYRSQEIARQVTLTDILTDRVDPAWITQKIVIIGTTASSIKDGFITPYSFGNTQEFHTPGVFFTPKWRVNSSVLPWEIPQPLKHTHF